MEFIYECDDVFPVDFCNRVIDKFEKSNLKFKGTIGDSITSFIKQSTDLRIYDEPEWVEEEKYFHDMIRKAMKKYETFLLKMDVDDQVKKSMSDILMNHMYIHHRFKEPNPVNIITGIMIKVVILIGNYLLT
jgi:hypothetical protein